MSHAKIADFIFIVFLCIQGLIFTSGICSFVNNSGHETFHPLYFSIDERFQPQRQKVVVANHSTKSIKEKKQVPFPERRIQKDGRITLTPSVPPTVAFVFGYKMDWNRVSENDLRSIPGISASAARRLILIRDTRDISSLSELEGFPHIGHKTVQRLQKYCFISNEP